MSLSRLSLRRWVTVAVAVALATSVSQSPVAAAFPGRNGRIVYERDGQIVTSSPRGDNVKVVVRSGYHLNPNWSADGKLIVWTDAGAEPNQIGIMRADGSAKRTIFTGPVNGASFAPDGKTILFEVHDYSTSASRLHTMSVDGTEVRKFAPDLRGTVGDGTFSPDGRWIAFTYVNPRLRKAALHIARRDGSRLRRLSPYGLWPGDAEWSPDGKFIAFADDGIWTVRLSDGARRKIAADGGEPAWSPDGRKIAYRRVVRGNYDLWVMSRGGANKRRLVATPKYETTPHWQPRP